MQEGSAQRGQNGQAGVRPRRYANAGACTTSRLPSPPYKNEMSTGRKGGQQAQAAPACAGVGVRVCKAAQGGDVRGQLVGRLCHLREE